MSSAVAVLLTNNPGVPVHAVDEDQSAGPPFTPPAATSVAAAAPIAVRVTRAVPALPVKLAPASRAGEPAVSADVVRPAAEQRLDQRLDQTCGAVVGSQIGPGLEFMRLRHVPCGEISGFVRVTSQVHPECRLRRTLANSRSAGAS